MRDGIAFTCAQRNVEMDAQQRNVFASYATRTEISETREAEEMNESALWCSRLARVERRADYVTADRFLFAVY